LAWNFLQQIPIKPCFTPPKKVPRHGLRVQGFVLLAAEESLHGAKIFGFCNSISLYLGCWVAAASSRPRRGVWRRTKMPLSLMPEGHLAFCQNALFHLNLTRRADQDTPLARK
jgi:hypothetical protein